MASPQKENGHTQIAHEILEIVVRTPLAGRHKDVLLFVMRKTYGWGKKEDYISLSQFVYWTGIDRKSICRIIKDLVDWKLIKKNGSNYTFQKDYSIWLVAPRPLGGSGKSVPGVVATQPHTKETITKEINTGSVNPKPMKNYEEPEIQTDPDYKAPEPVRQRVPYFEVFEAFGKYPKGWLVNKTEIAAAKRLLEEKGMEQIKKALTLYREYRTEKYCPVISSPRALEAKWENLYAFKTKNNL